MSDEPTTLAPAATVSTPAVSEPAAAEAAGWTPGTASAPPAETEAQDKPELLIGAAFGAGLLVATLLKRIGNR